MAANSLRVKINKVCAKPVLCDDEREKREFFQRFEYFYEDETPRAYTPYNSPRFNIEDDADVNRRAKRRCRKDKRSVFKPYTTIRGFCEFMSN